MKFYSAFDRPDKVFEPVDKSRLVEVAGYVPTQARIDQLMLAGQRLVESRKARYDWPDGVIDESYSDPTRDPGFDLADASQAMYAVSKRIDNAVKADKAAKALRAAQPVDPVKVIDPPK